MGVAQFSPWAMLYVRALHGLEPHEALVVDLGESLGLWEVVVQFSPDATPISTYMVATAAWEQAKQAAQPVPAQWVSADSMQQAAKAAAAEEKAAATAADLEKFREFRCSWRRPTKEQRAAKAAAAEEKAAAKAAAKEAAAEEKAAAKAAARAFRQRQAAFLEAFRQQQAGEKAVKRQRR
ncbi:hypothetical protein CHLRE_14g615300v5 [Chlamydomonas reinhardtii]|uniref:Uncharacterized protein n=1 Tax=Chlamydomonas reinhardtii TaxID=3055 RepID=A0A2K3CXJ8_CHLRE|nr:uncharacterized protein CHLRE_14g615300v5 [Chlamydomonas reinhardtii]PNW73011.1 hypothetical protein CHLRE_14g615300v5 [Chlamydomonas reinhardtii]